MASPLLHAHENFEHHLSLTLRLTASADRLPQITADLVGALSAFGTVATDVTVAEPATPAVVLTLPNARNAPLRVQPASRQVFWHGKEIALTRLEFDLLLFLSTRPNRVHRRRALMSEVWQTTYVSERTVDVHVRRLRFKIGADVELIRTVRGVGYQFGDASLVTVAH
jgi:DNA-binding response OmpR family regulator